jgi:DNA-binding response OmpR family regulator
MVLVIAWPEIAMEVGKCIADEKMYACDVRNVVDLRHRVKRTQPDLVIIDVRIGGSGWRAVDELARLRLTGSRPDVLPLVPKKTRGVTKQCAEMGCYNLVDLSVGSWGDRLTKLVGVCLEARARFPWRPSVELPSVELH